MKARIAASIVLAIGIAFGSAGCGLIAPQTTTKHYDASDGVSGNVGSVDVRNAMIITGSGNKVGNLVVTFVNNDDRAHYVKVQHGSKDSFVSVPADGIKKIGRTASTRVLLIPLNAKAGALTDVYFQYSDATGLRLRVPVLDGNQAQYADYAPGSNL